MRIVIAKSQVPFVRGGAEAHAAALREELQRKGHLVEIVEIPFQWTPAERILDIMMAWRLIDLSQSSGIPIDRVIAMDFPAYLVEHPNKMVWLIHQHRAAYDLWETAFCDLVHSPDGAQIRDVIRAADLDFLRRAKAIFSISENVADRLRKYCGFPSKALYHPPPDAGLFHGGDAEDYLFFPSRISRLKRQALVLEAVAATKQPVRVFFSGAPEQPEYEEQLRARASELRIAHRIEWLGWVSEEEKRQRYAKCVAVVFPPADEDYGNVTLEAMLSSKPVVTCTDSGGPLEFVLHEETGLICDPEPASLAAAFDRLWQDRSQAAAFGAAGRARYASMDISWETVVAHLCGGQ